jgi:glycine cleavage system H protein
MAEIPENLRYTNEHEWLRAEGDNWRVGITEFAQKQLGDVVMVDIPTVGKSVARGDELGTIESVKAVSQLYAPVSGEIVAVNKELESEPELLNTDPYGEGWIVEIKPDNRAELDSLLAADAYATFLAENE